MGAEASETCEGRRREESLALGPSGPVLTKNMALAPRGATNNKGGPKPASFLAPETEALDELLVFLLAAIPNELEQLAPLPDQLQQAAA
jgi:hypothetical protein